jgi:hypothetical protein
VARVAVFDLDGVLAEYHGWPKDGSIGKPIPLGVELAHKMADAGFDILVQSCRTNAAHGEAAAQLQHDRILGWLRENSLGFAELWTEGKAMGDVYFDDRAVHVPLNWNGMWGAEYFLKLGIDRAEKAEK